MCLLWSTDWVFISQKAAFFVVPTVKTSNLTQHLLAGPCSGDVMCLLWGTNRVFISQKTTFFIVIVVKTSNLACFHNIHSFHSLASPLITHVICLIHLIDSCGGYVRCFREWLIATMFNASLYIRAPYLLNRGHQAVQTGSLILVQWISLCYRD
jgi:hypothetical protein